MTTDLPPIDPVEALLVTVGLKAVISRQVERFKRSELRRAVELPKEIAGLGRKLVSGELQSGGTSDFHYEGMLKDLARGWDPEQVTAMMAQFPPDIGVHTTGLLVRSKQIVDALITDYPQTNYVTATGSINLVPADKRIFKFVQVLEVLCDPLSVFGLMSDGALLQTQVAAVRKIYPTLSTAIDASILEATLRAKAQSKAFELDPNTEIGVRAWFGKGPLPPEALKQAQAAVGRTKDRKAAAQSPPAGGNLPLADQTKAQRVESMG